MASAEKQETAEERAIRKMQEANAQHTAINHVSNRTGSNVQLVL